MEKVVHKKSLHIEEPLSSWRYWQTKTPAERMAALELIRIHAYSMRDNGQYLTSRLQRVCRIVKLGES